MIVSVQELISTLERIAGEIGQHSRKLLKAFPAEDELVNIAADLDRYPDQLTDSVRFIRDWNSRHSIPTP